MVRREMMKVLLKTIIEKLMIKEMIMLKIKIIEKIIIIIKIKIIEMILEAEFCKIKIIIDEILEVEK